MEIKLTIAICNNRPMTIYFVGALLDLQNYLQAKGIKGRKVTGLHVGLQSQVSILSEGRQKCLKEAYDRGHTHILYLDDDMVFPANMLDDLFAHEVDVVGVNYCRKTPEDPNMIAYTAVGLDGQLIASQGQSELVRASRLGTGLLLVSLEAIKDIKPPHFEIVWSETHQSYPSDDHAFCKKLEDNGVELWCDQALSHKVYHVGEFKYGYS